MTSRRTAAAVALAGALLFLLCAVVATGGPRDARPYGDVHLYRVYGEWMAHGRWPYRDFYDEYPPLAQPAFAVPALLPGSFVAAFKWTMALLGAASVALLVAALAAAGASRARLALAAAAAGVAPLVLGPTLLSAYDLWPAFLLAAALLAFAARRERAAFVLLALAVAAKVYPLAVLPVALVWAWERGGRALVRRGLLWFCGALALVHLPFAVVGPGGLRFSYWSQLKRGLEVESLGGSLLLVLERLRLAHVTAALRPPGSTDALGSAASALAIASTLLEIGAVLLVARLLWRARGASGGLVPAAVASVLGFLAFSKVISPQYVDWLIPLVPAAGAVPAAALLGVLGLTRVVSDRFHAAGAPNGLAYKDALAWWALARDLAIVALYGLVVARLARREGSARRLLRSAMHVRIRT